MLSTRLIWVALIFYTGLAEGSFASCIHGGTEYEDGDYFPPNQTFIATEGPLQCVQCRCSRGLVVCEVENCTLLECSNPMKHTQFCCRWCPGDAEPEDDQVPESVVGRKADVTAAREQQVANCRSSGRTYAEGSEWQPVIGPFGAMACVKCRCREGNVVCTRLRCDEQPCSHPRREFGECCPVCRSLGPESKLNNLKENNKSGTLCLPKLSEMFVFKAPRRRNDSKSLEYAFLENFTGSDSIILHTWNWKSPSSAVKVTQKEELLQKENFRLVGSVSHRNYNKFVKRGEKLLKNCPVECSKKIRRLENSLAIYPVTSKRKCAPHEMDVSNF